MHPCVYTRTRTCTQVHAHWRTAEESRASCSAAASGMAKVAWGSVWQKRAIADTQGDRPGIQGFTSGNTGLNGVPRLRNSVL